MDRQELIDRLNGNYPEYTKKSATKQKKVQHEGQYEEKMFLCSRIIHAQRHSQHKE